jgi:hypothetical protein
MHARNPAHFDRRLCPAGVATSLPPHAARLLRARVDSSSTGALPTSPDRALCVLPKPLHAVERHLLAPPF